MNGEIGAGWVVGREFDRSLEGQGRTGLRREYLRRVAPQGFLSLTSDVREAQRVDTRQAALDLRRLAWPRRVRGIRTFVERAPFHGPQAR